jgi:hypothetical protein
MKRLSLIFLIIALATGSFGQEITSHDIIGKWVCCDSAKGKLTYFFKDTSLVNIQDQRVPGFPMIDSQGSFVLKYEHGLNILQIAFSIVMEKTLQMEATYILRRTGNGNLLFQPVDVLTAKPNQLDEQSENILFKRVDL